MCLDPFDVIFTDASWLKRGTFYNKEDRKLYREITKSILSFEDHLVLDKPYHPESVGHIIINVLNTNPLTFGLRTFKVVPHPYETVVFFYYYKEEYPEWKDSIQQCVRDLYGELNITNCRSDLEKEIAVNDWLCDNCSYYDNPDYHMGHSVLGILLERRGVCSSFALATSLLLMCFGVKCYPIDGKMKNPHMKENYIGYRPKDYLDNMMDETENEPKELTVMPPKKIVFEKNIGFEEYNFKDFVGHAWNYVNIEGRWRHLDVTFNNGNHKGSNGKNIHSFFNLTDLEIKKDRLIFIGPKSNKKKK